MRSKVRSDKKPDNKTYVLTFNTLAGAGGFAKPRSKQQSAGLLLAAFGRPTCLNPTSSSTKKDPQPQLRISFGGSWWIRTTEALSSRFTVCPHWPLGKAPIFICASALTVLDYYSRIRWKKQALFQIFFVNDGTGNGRLRWQVPFNLRKIMLHRKKHSEIQGDHRPEYSAHANSAPWYFYACF